MFEILAGMTDPATARNGILLARQKLGGKLTIPTHHDAVKIVIDLARIEHEAARSRQAA